MKPARAFAFVLATAAVALAASIALKAALDVSPMWDVWYYHLPFAARIFDIVPKEAYAFHALNEARYQGFPLLGEALQGALWYLFRRPEAASFVAFASVGFFVVYLKYVYRVSAVSSVLALLAIPLVQTHASSCYVDLPANVAVAIVLLSLAEAFATPGRVSWRILARAGVSAAVAANMRLQLNPVVAIALTVLGARAFFPLLRAHARRDGARLLGVAVVAIPLIFATPLKNLAVHRNPVYPMAMTLAGVTLPGPEQIYSDAPPYLASAPRMQRFAYSVFEVGIRPMSDPRRWTVDQWMPSDATGNRMGGFFGVYLVAHLALFVAFSVRDRSRAQRVSAGLFLAATLFVSNAPQSHELRYYMFWMLVLVASNLASLARRARAAADGGVGLENAFAFASLVAVGAVAFVTRGAYVLPSGYGFDELVRDKVNGATLAAIEREGAARPGSSPTTGDVPRVCLAKEPWTLLYASPFHLRPEESFAASAPRYQVVEAESATQCEGARFVP